MGILPPEGIGESFISVATVAAKMRLADLLDPLAERSARCGTERADPDWGKIGDTRLGLATTLPDGETMRTVTKRRPRHRLIVRDQLPAPALDRSRDLLEGAALGGQRVLHAYGGSSLDITRDEPPRLQVLEPCGQGLGPDAVRALL